MILILSVFFFLCKPDMGLSDATSKSFLLAQEDHADRLNDCVRIWMYRYHCCLFPVALCLVCLLALSL